MDTKEKILKKIDELPINQQDEIFTHLLSKLQEKKFSIEKDLIEWRDNFKNFTPDFMKTREQGEHPIRELFS